MPVVRLLSYIRSIILAYEMIIVPIIFISFFTFGFVFIHKNKYRNYYSTVVIVLLLISSVLAIQIFPFTHAHRFTTIADQNSSEHDIRVVDKNGDELILDGRVALPKRVSQSTGELLAADNDAQIKLANQIMDYTNNHREEIESSVPYVRHPPPSVHHHWDHSTLQSYSKFKSIRIYEVNIKYKNNSTGIKKENEECILEIDLEAEIVYKGCSNV